MRGSGYFAVRLLAVGCWLFGCSAFRFSVSTVRLFAIRCENLMGAQLLKNLLTTSSAAWRIAHAPFGSL